MKFFLISLFFLFILYQTNFSQVLVNEYSCANISTITDNYGNYEDWIELYNTSGSVVNLDGYYLSDKVSNPTKSVIPAGVTIPANGYLLIFTSGRDEFSGGYLHTNFKLTQTKPESIVFSNPAGVILEQMQISSNQTGHSRGRTSNGAATWSVFLAPTPDAANSNPKQDYATKPLFSLAPGLYASAINVDITSPDPNITIRYTTNGSIPTITSTVVSGPIAVNATTVLRAKAFSSDPNIPASFIETNTYFINDVHTVAVLSICGDQVVSLLNGSYIEPIGSLEYFNSSQVFVDEATGYFNKHGNDSWAYDQRGIDFVTKDQMGYNYSIQDDVFRIKNRDEYQRLIIKAAANDNYPFEDGAHIRDSYIHSLSQIGDLSLDERSFEPCVLYVNGQYWGVYDLREKVDDADFTDYYYDQDENHIQFLKTWGGTWAEYGGAQALTDWNTIKNYILTNDMSIQANFDYVTSIYNWKSLVDYVVLNSYVVCSDWLNWNTAWWRGLDTNGQKKKWRYVLWDMDATFGHYINYTGIPNQNPDADPCNPEFLNNPGGQGHIPILNALMDNATFEQYYIARYADLSNTVFSCPFMQAHLDSLINLITPEMTRQINKWGGTLAGWQTNVQEMRDFIDERCAEISNGMIDCYNLTGPFQVTIQVDPPGSGDVIVNSLVLSSYPWTGTYYGNMNTLLTADDAAGWDFDYWELTNNTVLPDVYAVDVTSDFVSNDLIIAHFKSTISIDIGNDTTLCPGASLVLDPGHSGATFLWQNGSTDTIFVVTQPGTYSVTVTDGGTSGSADIVVTYMHAYAGSDQSICYGNSALLNASGGTNYLWSPSAGLSNQNISNPTATPDSSTTYSVTVTDINGCSDSDDVTIFVSPPVIISILANKYSVCPGETVILTPIISGGYGAPYTIYFNGNIVNPPIIVTPEISQTYEIIVEDLCGSVVHAEIFIETYPVPAINISGNNTYGCQPLTVSFTESGSIYNQFYHWSFGDGSYSNANSPDHSYDIPGIYDVSVTVTNSYNCTSDYTEPEMIGVYPLPTAKFIVDPEIVSIIKPIAYFTNLSTGAQSYIWSFGDSTTSVEISPFHYFPVYPTGIYNIVLIAITDMDCRDTVYNDVTVKDEFTFYAPTAFSPDHDGINDEFIVEGHGIDTRNFNLTIYDRWGEIIFESDDINKGWDGTVSGGFIGRYTVYTWLVNYKDINGLDHKKAGAVTLLK
ncbi:MAG: CotH kinase family protein [Bacteroidota bacterium]